MHLEALLSAPHGIPGFPSHPEQHAYYPSYASDETRRDDCHRSPSLKLISITSKSLSQVESFHAEANRHTRVNSADFRGCDHIKGSRHASPFTRFRTTTQPPVVPAQAHSTLKTCSTSLHSFSRRVLYHWHAPSLALGPLFWSFLNQN